MDIGQNPFILNGTNYIFIGEAGSGKSEIAINWARHLVALNEKPVHFFDMDMTKPLFRSRDVKEEIENMGVVFHHQEQFFDAPTLVGGVRNFLKREDCYTVLDIGGNDIGAQAIGGFAPLINSSQYNTVVYYVVNVYRPWSDDLPHIDGTLSAILKKSHIRLDKLKIISNPNTGVDTTAEEVHRGIAKMEEMLGSLVEIDFTCIRDTLYQEVKNRVKTPLVPLKLHLTYPWL